MFVQNSSYNNYPFGMQMPGRQNSYGAGVEYRYGYNGKENDGEMKGEGNSYDFGNRMYDPRLCRFFSVDKYAGVFADESPYIFAGNSPIMFTDYNGDFKIVVTKEALNAAKKSGISHKRFKAVVSDLNNYLSQNSSVVTIISQQTGRSREQILEDSKDGNGPTIFITVNKGPGAQTTRNTVDVATNEITSKDGFEIDYTLIQWFEEYKDKDDDSKAALDLILGSIVLHEYTHWGDRKMNKGNITGQGKENDIWIQNGHATSEPNGVQGKAAKSGHRGTDVGNEILGKDVSPDNSNPYNVEGVEKKFFINENDIRITKASLKRDGYSEDGKLKLNLRLRKPKPDVKPEDNQGGNGECLPKDRKSKF